PPGAKVPSEADLVREFDVSRSTVVRAVELLRQQGWLVGQKGVGREVLDRPPVAARHIPPARGALVAPEAPATAALLSAAADEAPDGVGAVVAVPAGASVVAGCRLVAAAQLGPVEMATV